MSQLTMEQLQQAYGGLTLNTMDHKIYPDQKELSRGPGTACFLRYNKENPNIKPFVYKYADFKSEEEGARIRQEANYGIPLINREKYTQKVIDYVIGKNTFQGFYEYIEGESLFDYRERRKAESNPILYQEAAALTLEIWKILEPLHARNVSHKNIKPTNIIRKKSNGRLYLGDFSFGNILYGKMHFGIKFNEQMALYNLCFDADGMNESTIGLRLDGYSLVMLFCSLLGKKLCLGQFNKGNPTNFINMSGLNPPVPDVVIDNIKFLSIGDAFGNRQPLTEVIRILSMWSNSEAQIFKQIQYQVSDEIKAIANLEIMPDKVIMIHPCSNISDEQFFSYMTCLYNKQRQPYKKINIHFGGNMITQHSFFRMVDALENLNTSNLKNLSIQMNYNNLQNIYNFVIKFKQLKLPCLEKLSIGFNSCQIYSENILFFIDSVLNQDFQNLKKLFLDFRGNCNTSENEQILDTFSKLRQKYKQKINSKDPKNRERFIVKFSQDIVS
ncbi:kinase domain protein (macronuclear) [Tetrahymena thermophila SB210]|uniref:Kinase domain protein n=1 Tax=Tetrahymena thermophila (strain SB210) TaxID=312017 RepID=I7M7B8_TETTS|nr:kinase domain protein [Tetrahymena thermophila SB210]EAR90934.2 kinase domain protein [Tetrahymena thermophila SB210]|eukprot:XP_001011179.2 kinase domain protein [Tetrahymena thermophila SB210]